MAEFRGLGRPFTGAGLRSAAIAMGLDPAADIPRVWAILTVESRGFGFLPDRRPKILFERHVFARQTNNKFNAKAPDISNKSPGGYEGAAAEYDRLQHAIALLKAAGQPSDAALKSVSWGLGQVMGFNHESVGYATVVEMVRDMLDDEQQHLMAMAAFVKRNKLGPKLQANDWGAVAEAYNGKNQAEHDYSGKLRAAFEKFAGGVERDISIRRAQSALAYLGFGKGMGDVDGILGDNTRRAIRAWRVHAGLSDNDRLDGEAFEQLMAAAGF